MANRRMLSRTIVESGEFEELSPMAQLLYMRMNLVADDDGFADCYALSRLLGTTQDEFDELADAGFIKKVQGRKCLYHIRHWRTHNSLEKAKYHASDHRDRLAELYQNDDYFDVLPAWERPVNAPVTQYSQGQVSPAQDSLGKENIVESMSGQTDADPNYDNYFKEHFPVIMKDMLASWAGFNKVTVDKLRELMFDNGIAPEVLTWIACKAADGATDPWAYFNSTIRQKCFEEGCMTLEDLIKDEGNDRHELDLIRQIANKTNALRAQVKDTFDGLPF